MIKIIWSGEVTHLNKVVECLKNISDEVIIVTKDAPEDIYPNCLPIKLEANNCAHKNTGTDQGRAVCYDCGKGITQ